MFSNNDINQFILMLRNGVYPYEFIDKSEKFKSFYMHVKIVCKHLGIKKVGKYCDLYLKSDIFG